MYKGKFNIFDNKKMKTYLINSRENRTKLIDVIPLKSYLDKEYLHEQEKEIEEIANEIKKAKENDKPVIIIIGAHIVKNNLSNILKDLIEKGYITHLAMNCATMIHDFELSFIGETSEHVPNGLREGKFGMAFETGDYINKSLKEGFGKGLGFGESIWKFMLDKKLKYREESIVLTAYKNEVPCTIHATIGTDIIDQHSNFSGEAKGGCSGYDFLIFVESVKKLVDGGVVLNIGSAVTGPEILLKAVSMVSNQGYKPERVITADFDLRKFNREDINDEDKEGYYYRSGKSVVVRIPEAYNGKGYYIEGNQKITIPLLYKKIVGD